MALYVVYRKTAETPTEVIYRFGSDETNLDRELVISKTGPDVRMADGMEDSMALRVAGRIIRRVRQDGTWVGGGAIQS